MARHLVCFYQQQDLGPRCLGLSLVSAKIWAAGRFLPENPVKKDPQIIYAYRKFTLDVTLLQV